MAGSFGISSTDPRRLNAGLIYAAKQLRADGSTASDAESFLSKAVEVLKIDRQIFFPQAVELVKSGRIVMVTNDVGIHFVADSVDYENERKILEFSQCS